MANVYITEPDGMQLPADELDQTFNWASGQLTSITVTYKGNTYAQIFTWNTDGTIQKVTNWTKQ